METGSGQLASIVDWKPEISLVPYSGVQFLDFGFSLDDGPGKSNRFIERTHARAGDQVERILIPLTGDPNQDEEIEAGGDADDDIYAIRAMSAMEPFLNKWVPVPVLRVKAVRGPNGTELYDPGPSNWARIRTVELESPDPSTGHTHRVQLAFDTSLVAESDGHADVGPTHTDAEKSREFRFVSSPAHMDWFLRCPEVDGNGGTLDLQKWVSDWLEDLFLAFRNSRRPNRRTHADELPHQFEHWARYLSYLALLDRVIDVPLIRLVNTISSREAVKPVEVDLVLDVGNSRTCGLLTERFDGESRNELARSFPLEVRDLSRPEFTYSGLFESRVEFAEQSLGDDRFSSRSGRRNAFVWPSFVRFGPEALRLVAGEEGTETVSGLSSPKRYLWDNDPVRQDWRFHHHNDPNNLPKSVRAGMRYLCESGDVLEQLRKDEADRLRPRPKTPHRPAIRPRFSRSSLFGFMLVEIIAHAMMQVNAPGSRSRRAQSDLPRRLNRVILTLPTATPAQELAIIRSRAKGALELVWAMMGLSSEDRAISQPPELVVDWDEASCTQLVYLFSELTQKFDGRIDRFLRLKGTPRPKSVGSAPTPSLRLACIDIGGGTTDMMVTTYWGEADRVLHPQQTFREGFRVAGDELLQRLISVLVIPQLQSAIEEAGGHYVGEKLSELFSGEIAGQDQQTIQRRRQFALRVLMPIAIEIMNNSETADPNETLMLHAAAVLGLANPETADGKHDSVPAPAYGVAEAINSADETLPQSLLAYLEDAAAQVGAADFRIADVVLRIDRSDVDAIAREVFQKAMGNLAEVIDHLGVDVVLLSGRPSRLPAVRRILEEMMVVPPHRLVSMHSYKAGRWYPFRDPVTQRISDPKSTVAVGGMLIALSEARMLNFRVNTTSLRMRSTARYIGEMDSSGQIPDARLLFADVDLDARRQAEEQVATLKMYTPLHIGSRQLPLERWTTMPLYRLDFATKSAQSRAPLTVTLERTEFDGEEEDQSTVETLRQESMREAFTVTELEDNEGTPMKPKEVELRLHTLGFDDDYWIDTGLFRL